MKKLILVMLFAGAASLYAEGDAVLAAEPQPFTLMEALDYALTNSPELRQEAERIAREEGVLVETKAFFLPSVNMNAGYEQTDRNLIPSFGGASFGEDNDWRVGVEISQTLYAGGRNQARRDGQAYRVDAVRQAYQAVVEQVIMDVRTQFFLVILARDEVVVQEENVRLLEVELEATRRRYDAGSLPQFNMLRAEVALANGQVPLIRMRNRYRLALDELARIIGYRPPIEFDNVAPMQVEGELHYFEEDPDLVSMLVYARMNRPELKQIGSSIQAGEQELKLAERRHLPEFSVYAGYAVQRDPFTASAADYNHGWVAGVRGEWNLFDGFASRGRSQAARADIRRFQAERDGVELQIEMQVRRALSELREARELVDASRQVVGQAVESVRLAQSRYDSGVGTQLELLDSQVALTQARSNEVRALFDLNVARAMLDRAIGRNDVITWK